jgi:vancomycin permeability regulator SanA
MVRRRSDKYPEPVQRGLSAGLIATSVLGGLGAVVGGSARFVRQASAGHIFPATSVPAAPVALVLGAQVYPDGSPSAFLAARLDLATRLYRAGKVQAILVSGDSLAKEYDEPEAMRSYLIAAGVPDAQVIIDDGGIDTYSSCIRARDVFGVSELTVVTQSYHLPRAVATCHRVGLSAYGVGADSALRYTRSWRSGVIREQLACVKTVLDLVTRRRAVVGPRSSRVEEALSR